MLTVRGAAKFSAILILGLGALTWIAYVALARTTRVWFEGDISLRAQLVVASARQSLVERWARIDSATTLTDVLQDVARDRRIMAVAACGFDGATKAKTPLYPPDFDCERVSAHVRAALDGPVPAAASPESHGEWTTAAELVEGPVHVTAIPLRNAQTTLGSSSCTT